MYYYNIKPILNHLHKESKNMTVNNLLKKYFESDSNIQLREARKIIVFSYQYCMGKWWLIYVIRIITNLQNWYDQAELYNSLDIQVSSHKAHFLQNKTIIINK